MTSSWNVRIWSGHDSEYIHTVGRYTDFALHNMRGFTHRLQVCLFRKAARKSAVNQRRPASVRRDLRW
jgi:hypothetical protein